MKIIKRLKLNLLKKNAETGNNNINEIPTKIKVSAITDVGLVRDNNEDNLFIDGLYTNEEQSDYTEAYYDMNLNVPHLFAIFDGMGGERAGEAASKIACQTLSKYFYHIKKSKNKEKAVERFYKATNKKIIDFMRKNKLRIGTTSVIALIDEKKITFFNCGDSRGYFYQKKDKIFSHKTYDHTLAQLQLEEGLIERDEYEKSSDRHKLTLYLGCNSLKKGYISDTFDINSGDCILLCSDGLYEMCNYDEIYKIITSNADSKIHVILNKVKENGGLDNTTIILIEII